MTSMGASTKALKVEGTPDQFAVSIMGIHVTESHLYSPIIAGPGPVHKIVGLPFCQEYRWDIMLWGTKLGFPEGGLNGSVGANGVGFLTRWGKGPNFQGMCCYCIFMCLLTFLISFCVG